MVRERNIDVQLFFKSQDFFACKILKNYYKDSKEEEYYMNYVMSETLKTLPLMVRSFRSIPKNS
ncbi:MAG: hypothetical protein AABW83_01930 [Nanoarchaeota archaeon]